MTNDNNNHIKNTINPEVRKLKNTSDGKSLTITLPKLMCQKLKWDGNNFLRITAKEGVKGNKVILQKV